LFSARAVSVLTKAVLTLFEARGARGCIDFTPFP
jgi:hypothetical protein